MAVPSNPLLSELVLEGIKQAGEFNPSAALIDRATNMWVEQIKNDIWQLAKKPKILQNTAYTVVNRGQSRYAYPDDYSSDLALTLLTGTSTGTCTGGSVNQVILGAAVGMEVLGKEILMMSGTSVGSFAQIVSVDTATNTVGTIPELAVAPVSGDTYMIVDTEYPVIVAPIYEWERQTKMTVPALPQKAYPMGDDANGYFVFECPPNVTYGLRLRYYVDISLVDVDSELMSVLYRRWRNIFIAGIKYMKLADENDDREQAWDAKYKRKLSDLIYREIYGMDISHMSDIVTDYY